MKKLFLILLIVGIINSQDYYAVTISVEDGDLYSINYGSFFVRLYAYKYPYGESVLLKYNGFSGEICWKEENYNYYNDSYETEYECFIIYDTYIEKSCYGCITKDGDDIDHILVPTDLSDFIN